MNGRVIFTNSSRMYRPDVERAEGEIVRQLGKREVDPEVGPMYEVRLTDGTLIDAFEDELELV